MTVDEVLQARSIANSAIATMQRFEIPATPANYAIWYEYHAGLSPNLKRTIDVLISNSATFNESTLQDLYATFFSSVKEAQAVREISMHALQTLQEIVGVADLASDDAHHFGNALRGFASKGLGECLGNLKSLIENLVEESKNMAGRSEYVGLRMRESAGKIEALERNLETAIYDSTIDGLTGVSNRKSFDAAIRKLAGEAMNSGDNLSMLMIDIDHFKRVNDTWGHQTGRYRSSPSGQDPAKGCSRRGLCRALWRRGVCGHLAPYRWRSRGQRGREYSTGAGKRTSPA